MKEIGKRLIAVLAALALILSVFPLGSTVAEVKADEPELKSVDAFNSGKDVIFYAKVWYAFKDQLRCGDHPDWEYRYRAVMTEIANKNMFGIEHYDPSHDSETISKLENSDAGRPFWEEIEKQSSMM